MCVCVTGGEEMRGITSLCEQGDPADGSHYTNVRRQEADRVNRVKKEREIMTGDKREHRGNRGTGRD